MNAMPEQRSGIAVCRFFSRCCLLLQAIRVIAIAALTYRMAEISASLALYHACALGSAAIDTALLL